MSRLPSARRGTTLAERLAAFRYQAEEDISDLALPPPDAGPVAATPAVEALGEYLSFELSGATYAVPLGAVQEILRARRLVEIPRASAPLLGVLDLRGTVTPVYDLGFDLGVRTELHKVAGPEEECEVVPRAARILVARTPAGPAGLWVDCVRDVVRLAPSRIEAMPGAGPVAGRASVGTQRLLLLELEWALW